jgi:hypothetical protein
MKSNKINIYLNLYFIFKVQITIKYNLQVESSYLSRTVLFLQHGRLSSRFRLESAQQATAVSWIFGQQVVLIMIQALQREMISLDQVKFSNQAFWMIGYYKVFQQ